MLALFLLSGTVMPSKPPPVSRLLPNPATSLPGTAGHSRNAGQRVAWIVAAIQFTNAMEYMAISPLFPWLAADLGIPVSWAGYAAGIYTLMAILSGVLAFLWIDRFDLKRLLIAALAVLAAATLAIPHVQSFTALIAWRAVAGLMGGLVMGGASGALLTHALPHERPALLARVVAAFSAVSIVGTPLLLWIAGHWGWQWSFRWISGCCLLCLAAVVTLLPACPPTGKTSSLGALLQQTRGKSLAYAMLNAISQLPALLLIPLLAPLLTMLAHQPDQLPLLFCAGGVAGLVASRYAGKHINPAAPGRWLAAAMGLFAINLACLMAGMNTSWIFIMSFMATTYTALVAASAISATWPQPERRASFCALQSAGMHLGSSLAFAASALIMQHGATQMKDYLPLLAVAGTLAIGLMLLLPRLQPTVPPIMARP